MIGLTQGKMELSIHHKQLHPDVHDAVATDTVSAAAFPPQHVTQLIACLCGPDNG